jgi:hypothetical protein
VVVDRVPRNVLRGPNIPYTHVPAGKPEVVSGEIVGFYRAQSATIRCGAALSCVTGGGFLLFVIIAWRSDLPDRATRAGQRPVWTWLTIVGGGVQAVVLALPMMWWGVAAYTAARVPNATAVVHELATLTWIASDQFLLMWIVPVALMSLGTSSMARSPFPRWCGSYTVFTAIVFEGGVLPYLLREWIFGVERTPTVLASDRHVWNLDGCLLHADV